MLKKIVTKNVGVLRAFDTPGSPQLAKLTMVYARNGRGKTTLSAVLRSSSSSNPSIVRGRQTLGGTGSPEVTLLFDSGPSIRFTGGRWTAESPVEVFDATFIAENLFAGERVSLEHDRSLFTIILGKVGVKLARHQEFFNAAAKRRAAALKAAEAALADDIPSDMSWEEFLGYTPGPTIDDQVDEAEKGLKAAQQAGRLAALRLFEKAPAPAVPHDLAAVLAATVDDIQVGVRDQLAEHFKRHDFGSKGEAWVRFGQEHIADDECPFCGRENVAELGIVQAYDKIFGEKYQAHLATVKAAVEAVENALGPAPREHIARVVAGNAAAAREWRQFVTFSAVELPDTEAALANLEAAHQYLKALLETKRASPLDVVEGAAELHTAAAQVAAAAATIGSYNDAIDRMNLIADERRSGPQATEADWRLRVDRQRRRKRRLEPGVQARIAEVLKAKRGDARARRFRTLVQDRLKAANTAAAGHYHERVNYYLLLFGATFRITEIDNSMTGNLGSVNYGLVLRGQVVGRGRNTATDDEPTFKNTLSSGDKTTLAFAFFLAGLDRDTGLAGKIIVFDDPLSSQDTHRQGKTVEMLSLLCGRCEQVIVLSHDAHFLRRVRDRCVTVDKVSYEVLFDGPEQWSIAKAADLDHLCRDAHGRMVDDLRAYYVDRKGDPMLLAPSVRKVLETHYRRSYPAWFDRHDFLGTIISKTRDAGGSHPCAADLADLEACNAATNGEHHGADPEVAAPLPPDPDDFHVVVRECLQLINVLPRPASGIAAAAAGDAAAAAAAAAATV